MSRELDLWAYQRGVTLDFSPPGKPTDNAFIESFNGKFRAECLNAHGFLSVGFVRKWGLGADNVRLVRFVRARISAENAQYGAASAGCGAYSGSNLPVSGSSGGGRILSARGWRLELHLRQRRAHPAMPQ